MKVFLQMAAPLSPHLQPPYPSPLPCYPSPPPSLCYPSPPSPATPPLPPPPSPITMPSLTTHPPVSVGSVVEESDCFDVVVLEGQGPSSVAVLVLGIQISSLRSEVGGGGGGELTHVTVILMDNFIRLDFDLALWQSSMY